MPCDQAEMHAETSILEGGKEIKLCIVSIRVMKRAKGRDDGNKGQDSVKYTKTILRGKAIQSISLGAVGKNMWFRGTVSFSQTNLCVVGVDGGEF